MSKLVTTAIQLGQSATATNNVTFTVPATPNSSFSVESAGATLMTVSPTNVSFNATSMSATNIAASGDVTVAGTIQNLQTAKAWVSFNGVGGASIYAAYNVSSVTRTAAGTYTVNFTTAMADSNYTVIETDDPNNYGGSSSGVRQPSFTTTSFVVDRRSAANAITDCIYIGCVVYGN